jgi:uncharacterized protein (TIGR00299 family) protein
MARVLYFDCFSGISGDMVLGALIDAGLPLAELTRALGSLAIDDVSLSTSRVLRAGVSATKFHVHEQPRAATAPATEHAHHGHHHDHGGSHQDGHDHGQHDRVNHDAGHGHGAHRSLPEIFALIDRSALSTSARARAKTLFQRLAEAEAAIHQMPVDRVHLHEVGAIDSIVDIVGAVFAMEWLGADEVVCSPLNVGGGTVDSAHGHFPVPAPATLRLLGEKHVPVYSGTVQQELVTPTGALIATSYASSYGPLPPMTVEQIGYGAGDRDFTGTPNVLRVIVGQRADRPAGDRVTVIECEMDDMNPQLYGTAMDRLYEAGALEVFFVPIQMKKNRPGTLLSVVAPPERRAALADVIFRETTTIGFRHYEVDRECLQRELVPVEIGIGTVRIKVASRDGRIVNAVPEYEDCAAVAAAHRLPVKEVQAMALQAFRGQRTDRSRVS